MESVTLPRNPVLPVKRILLPARASETESTGSIGSKMVTITGAGPRVKHGAPRRVVGGPEGAFSRPHPGAPDPRRSQPVHLHVAEEGAELELEGESRPGSEGAARGQLGDLGPGPEELVEPLLQLLAVVEALANLTPPET